MQRLDLPPCSDSPDLNALTVQQYFELIAGIEMKEKTRLLALARQIEARMMEADDTEVDTAA